MKGKIIMAGVLVLVGLALFIYGQKVMAGVSSAMTIENVYGAINSGDVDAAIASFAEDATAIDLVRQESYNGVSEIRQMLQGMHREGRRFDIADVRTDGDKIRALVEVSDRGHVWGTEVIEAQMKDDRLQSYTLKAFYLQLWRIGQE